MNLYALLRPARAALLQDKADASHAQRSRARQHQHMQDRESSPHDEQNLFLLDKENSGIFLKQI
jgi:hypothetical protein